MSDIFGGMMKKTEIYEYYAFGYNYGLIRRDGMKDYPVERAANDINDFMEKLRKLNLPVTILIAEELGEIVEELTNLKLDKVTAEYSGKIAKVIEKVDPALDAELQLKEAYVLTEKRYPLESLLEKPTKLLADGVFNSLTDMSKKDFSHACIQIALSQPTAAAFHLMRSLEEQVKGLYFAYKKKNRLEKPMWGPMINELRTKRAPKPSEKLLTHLDGMRIHFRNPTQHPDTFYTLDEAQDLLNQTITAINMVYREIK